MGASFYIVLIICILNVVVSLICLIWNLINDKGKIAFAYFIAMLIVPAFGPLLYLLAHIMYRTVLSEQEISYADISFDSSRHEKKQKGNFMEEVDILPLEEAFLVSNLSDRRKALLQTLKKDYSKNISTILMGVNNEDSETSHYAASVVMSASTDYLNMLAKLREEYLNEESEDQTKAALDYLAGLKEFMQSDIMDAVDKGKYIRTHTEVMEWMYKYARNEISVDDYVYQIELLLETDNLELSKEWTNRALHGFPDEDAVYYATMKMYFNFNLHDEFMQMLNELMKSNINISNETLQTIRFFTYQG